MVRETRHLWVGNLPENIREERIKEHFTRFGRVQSVKILGKKSDDVGDGSGAATVAFMDIKSANIAFNTEHKFEDRVLRTDYYDPSAFDGGLSSSAASCVTPSSRLHPEETLNAGGATTGVGNRHLSEDHYESPSIRSSHGGYSGRDFGYRTAGSRYPTDDGYNASRPRLVRTTGYRTQGGYSQDNRGGHYSRSVSVTGGSWKDAPSSPAIGASSRVVSGGITSADLGQLNCSQYLKDNGNNSPMSTGSSTASGSKRLNGTSLSTSVATRASSGTQNVVKSTKKKVTTSRSSRRRSRSSNSDSDSSGAGGGSRSSSSSSSSSRSSSSSSSSSSSRSDAAETRSRSPSPSPTSRKRSQNKSSLPVPFEDRTHCAICIRNPPVRPSDLSLQDSLFHEYKKVCSVCAVRIMPCGRTGRYAVIYFSTMADVERALEETKLNKYFLDWQVEVDVYLAGDELFDDKRLYHRPPDSDLDEYHPKATRTLYVGNLAREVSANDLHEKFAAFGEILEIDVKVSMT